MTIIFEVRETFQRSLKPAVWQRYQDHVDRMMYVYVSGFNELELTERSYNPHHFDASCIFGSNMCQDYV